MTPAPAFRMITAVLIGLGTAACASKASAPVNPTLQQTHSVECIASNVERSGCRTTHEFVVEFSAQPSPRPEEPAENTY